MAPRNVGIVSTEYVVKRCPHCLEMLTARLQFSAQAKVTLGATGWVRSRGALVPSAFNIAGLMIFAGNRHDCFQALVHAAHDRDAETEVDLIVCPKRGVPA